MHASLKTFVSAFLLTLTQFSFAHSVDGIETSAFFSESLQEENSRNSYSFCPPVDRKEVLSSGNPVELPVCYKDSFSLAIQGDAHLQKVNDVLKKHNLHAIPMNGKAQVQLMVLDYQSTLGPYKEVLLNIFVSRKKPRFSFSGILSLLRMNRYFPGPASEKFGTFVIKLWVNTEHALETGNELWGFNKSLANIEINQGFELRDESGELIVRSQWDSEPWFPNPIMYGADYYAITTGNNQSPSQWLRTQAKNKAWIGKFRPGRDTFLINEKSEWGHFLQSIDFEPKNRLKIQLNKAWFASTGRTDL